MKDNAVIGCNEAKNSCNLLMNSEFTRIPRQNILDLIHEFEEELIAI